MHDDSGGEISTMNKNIQNALQYIVNAGGNVTIAGFIEDHDPIGEMLLKDIDGLYEVVEGKMLLSGKGAAALGEATK